MRAFLVLLCGLSLTPLPCVMEASRALATNSLPTNAEAIIAMAPNLGLECQVLRGQIMKTAATSVALLVCRKVNQICIASCTSCPALYSMLKLLEHTTLVNV